MTIKFKHETDNYICKDYFYRFFKIYDQDETKKEYDIQLRLSETEFEQLFKDMAQELGYEFKTLKSGNCGYFKK